MTPHRLRPLQIQPVREKGRTYTALMDRDGYTDKIVMLAAVDAMIVSLIDGRRTTAQIAAKAAARTGFTEVTTARVEQLVEVLDANFMLESPKFEAKRLALIEAFRDTPRRPAYLAGRSYAAGGDELEKQLDAHFQRDGAPGAPGDTAAPLSGLVAPHIDYPRGGAGYAWAYREVLRSGLADLYVILGVAHQTPPTPFVLTHKHFATPFGDAEVDVELARALEQDAPFDLRADELVHRTEHSAEFQAVYLKYAQRKLGGDFKILPLLCSSYDLIGENPGERTARFLDKLLGRLQGYSGRVCLLAGVDFAHIGPVFGDPELTPEYLERTKKEDAVSLAQLEKQDADGFLKSVMFDDNARKVCGVSALYAYSVLHKALYPQAKGETLHYSHAADPGGGEVTFAAMAFR